MLSRMLVCTLLACATVNSASASDWTRFRGPNGSGVSPDDVAPPTTFSDTQNVEWKVQLPGPGLSSPIVIGDRVLITCWTGYATGSDKAGSLETLKRNIVCVDRKSGETLWTQAEPALLPEDNFSGMFAQNGYASHTPATDGERVYAFFGKTGVFAFNLSDGSKLWHKSVGEDLEDRSWGSASSPIVYNGLVIVPAFIEGDALVAFDGSSGQIAWEQKVPGYRSNWSTPILVQAGDRTDLVMAVPGEVWGLNPDNGKLRWYCEVTGSDSARASVIADGDLVIAMSGGRGASLSVAIRAGGKGAVEPVWSGKDTSSTGTPVIHDGRMFVINNKVLTTVSIKTGERLSQTRLVAAATEDKADKPVAEEARPESGGRPGGGGGPGGGRGGYGGRMGGQDYSSPVVAGNHLFYTARTGDIYVFELGDEPKQVAVNRFASDPGEYSATPAISDGQLFLRSSGTLYCVSSAK
ncbi:MAG: PQQ-binding-like beta-propeller repeat protein [Planctomycetaceae bacterium]